MLLRSIIATLLLSVLVMMLPAFKKKNGYTDKMGGVRKWHITHTTHRFPNNNQFIDTTYALPDTSFALGIIGSSTLNIMDENYSYFETNAANSCYCFGSTYQIIKDGHASGIIYYYNKNMMEYYDSQYYGHSVTHYYTY